MVVCFVVDTGERIAPVEVKAEVVIVRKGQAKRVWTPEQKSEIVHKHLLPISDSVSLLGTRDSEDCPLLYLFLLYKSGIFIRTRHTRPNSLISRCTVL